MSTKVFPCASWRQHLSGIPIRHEIENNVMSSECLNSCMKSKIVKLSRYSAILPRETDRAFDPRWVHKQSCVEIAHEIFSVVILSIPRMQEGNYLVNRLED